MTDNKPSAALLIAREALAAEAESRDALTTAAYYRNGTYDDNGEIRTAVLVATAALESVKLTLSRSKIFIGVLLDYLDTDAADVNIQVRANGEEKARIELTEVIADIDRLIGEQ